jgi:hypothetical protein
VDQAEALGPAPGTAGREPLHPEPVSVGDTALEQLAATDSLAGVGSTEKELAVFDAATGDPGVGAHAFVGSWAHRRSVPTAVRPRIGRTVDICARSPPAA